MRNFKLSDGDLVLGQSNRLETVSDFDKLIQDLKCWLMEPYGTGFMTPNFGSFLNNMIGRPMNSETEMDIRAEIDRILSMYQAAQQEKIKLARYKNTLNVFSRKEILNKIKNITMQIDGTRRDAYKVSVVIENASSNELALNASINEEGVTVASS